MAEMVRSIFRISIIKRTTKGGLAFIQAFGRGDPDDPDNQDLIQEDDLDHAQHYGLETRPPTGVDVEGVVVDSDGGEVCIAERFSLEDLDTHGTPDEMPARNPGDTVLYAKDGTYIFLDADGKLTIKAMTDNVEIITEAGKRIRLGQDGATYRDVAYAHNTEAGASKVASGAALDTWTHQVRDDIAAIKVDLDQALRASPTKWGNKVKITLDALTTWATAGGGPGGAAYGGVTVGNLPGETLVPNVTDGINADTDHSYASSGSSTSEVEP
jgi:hypothetical protein